MIARDYVIIETVSRVAPLGVRFFDTATRSPFQGALEVSAYSSKNPARRLPMFANPSGIYVLHNVPGLRDFETGAGDDAFWAAPRTPDTWIIEVRDPQRSVLPFRFEAEVPTRGLYQWDCPAISSPPASPPQPGDHHVPIYPSVLYAVPAGMADLRADLYDPVLDRPAAWAVVEIYLNDDLLARGLSDAQGRVHLIFAYPEPLDLLPASPSALGQPLSAQEWALELRAGYVPSSEIAAIPDLCEVLSQLDAPAAHLWDVWDATPAARVPLPDVTLRFGKPFVARSHTRVNGPSLSMLWITSAV